MASRSSTTPPFPKPKPPPGPPPPWLWPYWKRRPSSPPSSRPSSTQTAPVAEETEKKSAYNFDPFDPFDEPDAAAPDRVREALDQAPWPDTESRSEASASESERNIVVKVLTLQQTDSESEVGAGSSSSSSSKKVVRLLKAQDAATQTDSADLVRSPWWRPPRPPPQRSLLKSKRGDRPGPGQRAPIDLEERPPVVVKHTVTNYKFACELYGVPDTIFCEGGCERRVKKARGGLMPSTFSEFCQKRSTQMLSTFVCNSCAEAYADKLLSFSRSRAELWEQQKDLLLGRR